MEKFLSNRVLSSFYTLIFILSVNWFLPIFDSLLSEASLFTRIEIITYLGCVVALELLALFVVTKFYKGFGARHLRALVISFFLAVNLAGLLLTFYEPFLIQSKAYKIGEFAALLLVFYILCLVLEKRRFVVGGLSLLYLLMVAQQVFVLAMPGNGHDEALTFSQFKAVEFTQKPNVYLISFDSLVPPALAAKNLGLDDLQYVKTLEQNGARTFKNTFSDHDSTMTSLPLIFYLDPDLWEQNLRTNEKVFSGLTPTPLQEIFKHNGYKISAGFTGNYKLKGKYVDEFLSTGMVKSYCDFALPWYYMQHLGYCSFKLNVLNKNFSWSRGKGVSFNEQVFDSFSRHYHAPEPWLHFVYFYTPGHTPLDYSDRIKGQRERYAEKFSQNQITAAKLMQSLIDEISTNDPEGIILFFGDHGPWMSRGLKLNDENAEFIVQDRHGVLSAIYPGDACPSVMGHEKGDAFVTPSLLVRRLLTCLSGGDDPIDWDVNYAGPYEAYKFGDFVYE